MKRVLTIAGSDATGGAGLEADLKIFEEYGLFGQAAITTIVTMDPKDWHHEVTEMPVTLVEKQVQSALDGGKVAAIKTGMLGNETIIENISHYLSPEFTEHIIIDPVIACKGTAQILQPKSVVGIKRFLLPKAQIVTPNLVEAGILSDLGELTSVELIKEAAKKIHDQGAKRVVIKGGKRLAGHRALDVFYDGTSFEMLESAKIDSQNNHGAGCAFAAAITAGVATGMSYLDAVIKAKEVVYQGILHGASFNAYVGHLNHSAYFRKGENHG
ncbi:bifunctional hydroxymethylpyrimidine kinase/phosphomethylpyrimidine kinase [uncultured Enterococcus sp.]|uniref:bifunctional hydroxymethylpyrimidine kinase/phosphomethylpyrimidine kinase n=1 Tax=uncultured Enterococcus sp. TaxID=167972 RepID=UPI0025CF40CB|nr:bifunctional hydroxymethylpyrimidine kinase/phosphomethylpyrimidine kinase [uncultured Enterococcus sp.]